MQRTAAGSVVVGSETGRNSAAGTTFGARSRDDRVVNPGIPDTERYAAGTAGVRQSNRGRNRAQCPLSPVNGVVEKVSVHIEERRPAEPTHSDIHAEQIELGVPCISFRRSIK